MDDLDQIRAADGLCDEPLHPLAEADGHTIDVHVNDTDDLDPRIESAGVLQRLRSVQSRHGVIQQHDRKVRQGRLGGIVIDGDRRLWQKNTGAGVVRVQATATSPKTVCFRRSHEQGAIG